MIIKQYCKVKLKSGNYTLIVEVLESDEDKTIIPCPVCGEPIETDDICDKCGWQNTGIHNVDGVPYRITLAEARMAYAEVRKIK